jgi:hypothetical protein
LPGSDRWSGDASTADASDADRGDAREARTYPWPLYCQVAGATGVECGSVPAECANAWTAYCLSIGDIVQPWFRQAWTACSDPQSCCASSSCPEAQIQDCVAASTLDASPTAAQALLAQDYCATCSPDVDACDSIPDFSYGGWVSSSAYVDGVAQAIEAMCTGAKLASWINSAGGPDGDCTKAFVGCALSVVSNSLSTQARALVDCLAADAGALDAGVE